MNNNQEVCSVLDKVESSNRLAMGIATMISEWSNSDNKDNVCPHEVNAIQNDNRSKLLEYARGKLDKALIKYKMQKLLNELSEVPKDIVIIYLPAHSANVDIERKWCFEMERLPNGKHARRKVDRYNGHGFGEDMVKITLDIDPVTVLHKFLKDSNKTARNYDNVEVLTMEFTCIAYNGGKEFFRPRIHHDKGIFIPQSIKDQLAEVICKELPSKYNKDEYLDGDLIDNGQPYHEFYPTKESGLEDILIRFRYAMTKVEFIQ